MKKALITGITGFAGSHLAEYLVSRDDYSVIGTYLNERNLKNIAAIQDRIRLFHCDLMDHQAVQQVVQDNKPDSVFHLAALPSPANSYKDPARYLQNNIVSELNVLEAIRQADIPQTRVLIVSSSEVYGRVMPEDLPIDEETPFRPINPYGVSKITQDFLGLQYYLAYDLDIIRVRPFGHIGPRLSPDFASSAFAKKIAEIEKKQREPILTVGNLEYKRDLTDVRDMVKGYVLLLEKGKKGDVYNLGSGKSSYKTGDLLEILLTFTEEKIQVQEDPALLRPNDIPELLCDNRKMRQLTGWTPEVPIETSLRDLLAYWREKV